MVLETTMAKNYEKIIKSGNYDAEKMLSDLAAARKRNRIRDFEYDYLVGLVEADLITRQEEQLKQLGK